LTFARSDKEVTPFVAERYVGEAVSFSRNGFKVMGRIHKILENSVIVELSDEDALLIGAKSNLTVVSHKNYTVRSNSQGNR